MRGMRSDKISLCTKFVSSIYHRELSVFCGSNIMSEFRKGRLTVIILSNKLTMKLVNNNYSFAQDNHWNVDVYQNF